MTTDELAQATALLTDYVPAFFQMWISALPTLVIIVLCLYFLNGFFTSLVHRIFHIGGTRE